MNRNKLQIDVTMWVPIYILTFSIKISKYIADILKLYDKNYPHCKI